MSVGAIALAVVIGTAAHAQTIYKCKGADGRITYSSVACPGEGSPMSGAPGSRGAAPTTPAPAAAPGAPPAAETAPVVRGNLPKQCDNAAALAVVVARLDNAATPDDIRPFLADERFRLLRCEFLRLTPEERRERDAAMRDLASADPNRRNAAALRIEAMYDRYLTQAERAERARNRQR
ncbi:MAG: DUF4124 domain-containing protein [Burkholderiales bacterium]